MKKRMIELSVLTVVMFATFSLFVLPVVTAEVPNPTVIGPIPVNAPPGDPYHDYTFFTPIEDLSSYGYVQEEFFIEGTACRYNTPSLQTGSVIDCDHPYKTRIVVRRPISAKRFNGTVLLEWQNVTAGYDLDAHWGSSWEHFMRSGYAWIGVSAQHVGVDGVPYGLKNWSPVRYGTLDVTAGGSFTSDQLSFDIFAQAAQAVRSPEGIDPMGGLKAKGIFAIGASQSEAYLVTYHNSIHPLHEVVDAFYLLVGVGRPLRTDLSVKVFKVNTETDVAFLGEARIRQPDSDHLRTWEIAGAAHSGYFSYLYRQPLLERDGIIPSPTVCTLTPYSRIPSHYVLNAAYDHLLNWVADGTAPPTAPQIEGQFVGSSFVISRDEFGLALGGIRLPQIEVPIALNTGANSGTGFCFLYGSYQPFDDETLRDLYRNHGTYVSAFDHSVNLDLKAGYIVNDDAREMRAESAHSDIPPK
jgi:hypothetical protein